MVDRRFLRGVAMSTFQSSGEQGFASNWSGRVNGKQRIGRSCDFWNRWGEDIALARNLGVNAFKLTLEWHILEPLPNVFNMDAFHRYKRMLQSIQEAGMYVVVTLHHFTHPSWFEARGGFTVEENVDAFIAYVQRATQMLGGWVDAIVTFNEAAVFAVAGHVLGAYPPGGIMNYFKAGTALLHMLKAHTQAYHTIKAENMDIQVGFVHRFIELHSLSSHVNSSTSSIVSSSMNEAFATQTILTWFKQGTFDWQGAFTFGRKIHYQAPQPPPLDFWGVNASPPPLPTIDLRLPGTWKLPTVGMSGVPWSARGGLGSRSHSGSDSTSGVLRDDARSDSLLLNSGSSRSGWGGRGKGKGGPSGVGGKARPDLNEQAAQLTSVLKQAGQALQKPLYVMDFGVDEEDDEKRTEALMAFYCAILEAAGEGAPVHGIFYWTLVDGFDWSDGFKRHYGMYSFQPGTLERMPRAGSIELLFAMNEMLPNDAKDTLCTTDWAVANIRNQENKESLHGKIQWKFMNWELASRVVQSADVVTNVLERVHESDIGAVLLTSKQWSAGLTLLLQEHRQRMLTWEPWATELQLHCGEPATPLENLPDTIVPNKHGPPAKHLSQITMLWFRRERFWRDQDVALVLHQVRRLRMLSLSDHGLSASGARLVAPVLAAQTKLTCLSLDSNSLGANGAVAIAPVLRKLPHLRILGLHDNQLGEEGVQTLVPALRSLTKITLLAMRSNRLGEAGMEALARALSALPLLQSFGIHDNELEEPGAHRLAAVLPALTALTLLNVSDNALREEGARVLAPALQRMPQLRELWINGNHLGDSGVRALVEGWHKPGALGKVSLGRGNHVTDEAKKYVPRSWDGAVQVDWREWVCSVM